MFASLCGCFGKKAATEEKPVEEKPADDATDKPEEKPEEKPAEETEVAA